MRQRTGWLLAGGIVSLSIFGRLLPHPPNFTPLGGAAVFGGANLPRPWNYLVPIIVLALSDMVLGWHQTMIFVYGSFLVAVWLGERLLSQGASRAKIAAVSLANSTIFFLVTNFGVWYSTTLYPKTMAGLYQSYLMGLPFWRPTILADLIFTFGFFALYRLMHRSHFVTKWERWMIKSWQGGVWQK